MSSTSINANNVRTVQLGLVNRCNLRCPGCMYVLDNISKEPKQEIDLLKLVSFLDKLPNLEKVNLEGDYSEPTLYKYIIELIVYLKLRDVSVEISTNGDISNNDFWKKLGQSLGKDDVIRFAIDGHTQKLHATHRVGGSLGRVLNNHNIFKNNSDCITVLQHIEFMYNKDIDKKYIEEIFQISDFDYLNIIKSCSVNPQNPELAPKDEILRKQNMYNKISETTSLSKICDSSVRKEICITPEENVTLCTYRVVDGITLDNTLDEIFDSINETANTIDGCETCNEHCNIYIHKLNKEFPDLLINKDMIKHEVTSPDTELKGMLCKI